MLECSLQQLCEHSPCRESSTGYDLSGRQCIERKRLRQILPLHHNCPALPAVCCVRHRIEVGPEANAATIYAFERTGDSNNTVAGEVVAPVTSSARWQVPLVEAATVASRILKPHFTADSKITTSIRKCSRATSLNQSAIHGRGRRIDAVRHYRSLWRMLE